MGTFEWDETSAREFLTGNFTINEKGIIRADNGHKPTGREMDAIEWLFENYDYGYNQG